MGLSTHVLDTMHGRPAAAMQVEFFALDGEVARLQKRFTLNADGRDPDGMLVAHDALAAGIYRLRFDVAGYFRQLGVKLPEPNFLNWVCLDFGIAHPEQHYHVPLLVTPWGYSTYRGS